MKRIFFLLAAALYCLTACNNEADELVYPSVNRVTISPAITTRATEMNFEEGDKIGLTIIKSDESSHVENALLTYMGDVFTGNTTWYTETNDVSHLVAYYPYNESGAPTSFTVVQDQSGDGYGKSDLMGASKPGVEPTASSVNMVFKHLLTRLIVNVTNESDADVTSVAFQGVIPTADVDLRALTAQADNSVAPAEIMTQQVTRNALYRVIVVPQEVAMTLAVKTSDGKTLTQPLATATLKQGVQYTVNVTVSEDDKLKVTVSGEIDNWADEGGIGPARLPVISIENLSLHTTVAQKDTLRLKAIVEYATPDAIEWIINGEVVSTDPLFKFTSTTLDNHNVTLSVTNDYGTATESIDLNVYPQFRHGTWILNEGNMSNETGSLTFISAQGVIENYAYLGVNERLLGNACQDLFIHDGKMYIVSQNGNKNITNYPVGFNYPNEEFLTVCNAETLEREVSYGASDLPGINWPTHIAVLDAQNAFIRDNNGVHLFNMITKTLTLVAGTSGAKKNTMAVVANKVFVANGNNVQVLTAGQTSVTQTISMGAAVSGVVKSSDGNLWVATTGTPNKIAKINPVDYSIIKENEVTVGSVSASYAANAGICAIGDMLYYCGLSTKIYRHNFTTGVSELLLDAKNLEPNAGMAYNNIGVNPVTGEVVMTTIKGYGMNYLINNIMMFDFSGSSVMTHNYADHLHFPAGVFFTYNFE